MKVKSVIPAISVFVFLGFCGLSIYLKLGIGIEIAENMLKYSVTMLKILPFAFILIGLFEVWVKKETVEKHLGKYGGLKSFVWAILLGGITIGPMIVSLPVSAALSKKGARLSVLFTYIGASSVCRIPMTIFELSYVGIKFTAIRYLVSIPLIIVSAIIMGRFLEKRKFEFQE